ncbi:hypothetical protein IMZ48_29510 [Candidatus Bathyarchaeota archaeon]|nr:hypothetical protein [Candidatus Bathyarchaeota archaeon]
MVDIGAAGDEPEDQLLMIFVPRAMENPGAQLDAELDVLFGPEKRPVLFLVERGLGQPKVMFEALANAEDIWIVFLPTLTVATLIIAPIIGIAGRGAVDMPEFGPVGVVPDLLGIENKIDGK